MFYSEPIAKRIEKEKPLFDFARMYITAITFIGFSFISWKLWSYVNIDMAFNVPYRHMPIHMPKIAEWIILISSIFTTIFTFFLYYRITRLSFDTIEIGQKDASNWKTVLSYVGTVILIVPLSSILFVASLAIMNDIR